MIKNTGTPALEGEVRSVSDEGTRAGPVFLCVQLNEE